MRKNVLALLLFFSTPTLCDEIENGMSKYFSSFTQVKVSQIGPVYILDGTVEAFRDLSRVNEIALALRDKGFAVRSFVELSKDGKDAMATFVERQIGSPDISVRFVSERLFLEGVASNDFEADRAIEIAKASLFSSIARRPAQDDHHFSIIVDLMKVRPAAPPMLLPKTKKLSKAP